MTAVPEKRRAKRIIQSLRESGQPPKLGARFFNVGTEYLIQQLRDEYLQDYLRTYDGEDGGGVCKWVEAQYGNGKTQFLRCMQEEAWEANYVTAFVELSQDECPLDRPDQVYRAIASSIQARPASGADIDKARGLDVALEQLLDRKFDGALSGSPDPGDQDRLLFWIDKNLALVQVESTAFRHAVVSLLKAVVRGETRASGITRMYLRGEPVPPAQLKEIGIFEKLDKATGVRMLRSMCQLLQRSELAAGTVLLFDEARRSLSLMSSKQQKVACENLLSVINHCNSGDLPGTLFLYAVMPEFFTDFATAYPALQQRCGPATRLNLEQLQSLEELDLLQQIGEKITSLFRSAYDGYPEDSKLLDGNCKQVAQEALARAMVSGQRRAFVTAWVATLEHFHGHPMTELTQKQVGEIMDGVQKQIGDREADLIQGE